MAEKFSRHMLARFASQGRDPYCSMAAGKKKKKIYKEKKPDVFLC